MIVDMLKADRRVKPQGVLIDHVEEHAIKFVLDAHFRVGMTLCPVTKCTPEGAVDMVEMCGPDRRMANGAGDRDPATPMNLPDMIRTMRARGHSDTAIKIRLREPSPIHHAG
jgi:predicted metal-dependent TIM-barrel fold hydrolase